MADPFSGAALLPDVVSMQCRQESLEGTGEIKLRRLVKKALRMRPSRIIVGEMRQEESLDIPMRQQQVQGVIFTLCRQMLRIATTRTPPSDQTQPMPAAHDGEPIDSASSDSRADSSAG
jgi:hypothetical protein